MNPTLPDITYLSDSLISEIVKDFGLPKSKFLNRVFHPFFHRATDRLAALGLEFDQTVRDDSIAAAARRLLARFCHPVQATGTETIPDDGPVLVVSNHPGTFDGVVLFSQIMRRDARFISSSIPFVMALPHTSEHFIFVNSDTHKRMMGVRQAIRHLQRGGTVLVFGSGHIDPDPGVYEAAEAAEHIKTWWPSAEFLLNAVPGSKLVLSMISHVVSPRWARHPITWLGRSGLDRRRLGEIGQLAEQLIAPAGHFLTPRIRFSVPYSVETLHNETSSERIMPAIIQHASELLYQSTTVA